MMDIKRIVLSAVCAGLATAVFAVPTTNYWVGGSGNWSEVSNWFQDSAGTIQADTYPGADGATDVHAIFTSKAKGTITIDKDVTIPRFIVEGPSSASSTYNMTFTGPGTLRTTITADGASTRTRFTGNRTITMTDFNYDGTFLDFDKGKAVIGAGANIKCSKTIYVWHNNASMRVLPGCNIEASKFDLHYAGASLSIEGGTINASLYSVGSTRIEISGGDITAASMPDISANGTFIFTNGTLTVTATATTTDRRLFGSGDAVYKSTMSPNGTSSSTSYYSKRPSINVFTNDGDRVTFNTIFATNGNYGAFHTTNSATAAGGTMNAARVTIAAAKNLQLDVKRLNLGVRLFPTVNGASMTILDGITFGAFGDWYVYDKTFTMYLNGDIVVDTTDCFDGVTPHTIGFWKTDFKPSATLTVCGNGTCDLAFSSVPNILRRIDVQEGATLQITNNTKALSVDELSLGANATLTVRAAKSHIDAANVTADPTAALSVVVPAGLTAHSAYPALAVNDDETAAALAANATLTGAGAAGWSLRHCANTVYIANGVEPTYTDSSESNIWTGAVSGYWNDAGNWKSGVVPYSTTRYNDANIKYATYIAGTCNTDITNNIEGTTYITRLAFLESCGPVRISGGKLGFGQNGYRNRNSSPIFSFSRFPAIIESDVNTVNSLSTVAAQDSYVALNGTTTIAKLFRPTGEIRVGGDLTCTQVLLESTMDSGRDTKMHVLAGGKVTATAQVTNQVVSASRYVVDEGGELVFEAAANAGHGARVAMNAAQVNGLIDFRRLRAYDQAEELDDGDGERAGQLHQDRGHQQRDPLGGGELDVWPGGGRDAHDHAGGARA